MRRIEFNPRVHILRIPQEVSAKRLVQIKKALLVVGDDDPGIKDAFYRLLFSLPRVCKASWERRELLYRKIVFDTISIESYLNRGPKDLFFPESVIYGSLALKAIQKFVSKIPKVKRLRIEYLGWNIRSFSFGMSVEELPNLERLELVGIGVVWDRVPTFESKSKKFERTWRRDMDPRNHSGDLLMTTPDYLDDLDPRTLYGRVGIRLIKEGYVNVVRPEYKNFLLGFIPTPQQCRFLLTFSESENILADVFKEIVVLAMTTPGVDGGNPQIVFSCRSEVTGLEVLEIAYETYIDPTNTSIHRQKISEEMMFEALEILKKENVVFFGP